MKKIIPLLVLSLFAISACTKKERVDPNSKIVHVPLSDDAKSLDPASAYDVVSLEVMPLCVESLFQYNYLKTPLELEPLLADGMPVISKDKKTFTIKIKKGVMFQDDAAFPNGKGRELKAQDFLYAWKRLLVPTLQSPGTWIFEDKVVGYSELKKEIVAAAADKAKVETLLDKPIEGFQALDDYTIQVKLLQPYPQLLHVLAMGFGAPVPREAVAKYGQEGLNEQMVGTGPYILKEFVKSSKIVLTKNPNFHGEKYPSNAGDEDAEKTGLTAAAGASLPFVDTIYFDIFKEEQPQWLQFQAGKLETSGIPKDNFSSAISGGALAPDLVKKGITLKKTDESVTWYLEFNMKDKLLGNNGNLRKAISRAINRDEIIQLFANGRAIKASSVIPPTIAGFTDRKELDGDYNVEEAKKYLAKAGYPEGKGLPVLKYDLRGASTSARQMGDYFADSLKKIGVNVQVEANTFPAFLEKAKNGNLQFFMGGWVADYPDAENFLQLLYSKNISPGPNDANFVNPQFDKLYEKIASMTPSKERTELIKKAEQVVFDNSPWSMLYYPVLYSLSQGWVQHYRHNELILNDLKYLDIDLAKKKELLQNF